MGTGEAASSGCRTREAGFGETSMPECEKQGVLGVDCCRRSTVPDDLEIRKPRSLPLALRPVSGTHLPRSASNT